MNRKTRILHPTFESSRTAKLLVLALVVMFTSTAALAWPSPQGTFDRTLHVTGPVDLEVLTHSGDVRVRAGSSGTVQIHGKIFVGSNWLLGHRDTDVHAIEQNPQSSKKATAFTSTMSICATSRSIT